MKSKLTKWLVGPAIAALVATAVVQPAAAAYPDKPITMLIAFSAGGGADTLGRLVAKAAAKALGQPVVAVNKPGGGGAVMGGALKNAAPDGYTIGIAVTLSFAFNPEYSKKTPYKMNDFTYLATVAKAQEGMVSKADKPWKNWGELIAHAKKGNAITMVSLSPVNLLMAKVISAKEGITIRPVPVKGGSAMVPQILGGHVDFGFSGGIHQRYLKPGDKQMRVLASARYERLKRSPDVPTLDELGYGIGVDNYFQLAAPKGLPAGVMATLSAALKSAINDADVQKLIAKFGMIPQYMPPAELDAFMAKSQVAMKALVSKGK